MKTILLSVYFDLSLWSTKYNKPNKDINILAVRSHLACFSGKVGILAFSKREYYQIARFVNNDRLYWIDLNQYISFDAAKFAASRVKAGSLTDLLRGAYLSKTRTNNKNVIILDQDLFLTENIDTFAGQLPNGLHASSVGKINSESLEFSIVNEYDMNIIVCKHADGECFEYYTNQIKRLFASSELGYFDLGGSLVRKLKNEMPYMEFRKLDHMLFNAIPFHSLAGKFANIVERVKVAKKVLKGCNKIYGLHVSSAVGYNDNESSIYKTLVEVFDTEAFEHGNSKEIALKLINSCLNVAQ